MAHIVSDADCSFIEAVCVYLRLPTTVTCWSVFHQSTHWYMAGWFHDELLIRFPVENLEEIYLWFSGVWRSLPAFHSTQKFNAVWTWSFLSQAPPPSPEAPPSWMRRFRMLTRRRWVFLRYSSGSSTPPPVSEHSCTARCSSTFTGKH